MSTLGFVQKDYSVQITTSLGPDPLLVEQMEGEESISGLSVYRLRMVSENSSLALDAAVGQTACLSITMPTGTKQFVHGIIGRFRQAQSTVTFTTYYADLYPRLWLLTKTSDSRIFQNKSVPDIVRQILSDHGVADIKDALTATHPALEYCVQYQETAFDFIARLMENEGIAYRFEHTEQADMLVLTDDTSSYGPGPSLRTSVTDTSSTRSDALQECSVEVQVTAGKYKLDDYNFELPSTNLLGVASGKNTDLMVYEYPAGTGSKDVVEAMADRRLQELELPRRVLRGASNNAGIRAGHKVTLVDHPRKEFNTEYVVLRMWHHADQNTYSNTFEAFPADVPFRPPRVTPSPRIHGCQTAVVVGKSGEEITTDKYGRVKVKFHWDQSDVNDERSSCWVRVAQGWAGKQWGTLFLPRIGQEVVVSFLDGNPDRPIITGCVYNAKQTLPYTLPDNQTRSVIKSDSSKGGGGANEIHFEDKKGEEELFVQAQKDMKAIILNDMALTIGGKVTLKVTGDLTLQVTGSVTIDSTGDLSMSSKGAVSQKAVGAFSTESTQNVNIKAGINLTQEAGAALKSKAGATHNVEAGAILILKGAMVKIN